MTLNGHFALKYVSGSAYNGLTFWLSGKLYGNCRATHILSAAKNVAQLGAALVIQVLWGYSLGFPEEEASNQ